MPTTLIKVSEWQFRPTFGLSDRCSMLIIILGFANARKDDIGVCLTRFTFLPYP